MAKREYKKWTEAEDSLVRQGKLPEGRTYAQCASHAHAQGIDWAAVRMEANFHYWTAHELDQLREGKIPQGRTVEACRQARRLYGIECPPFSMPSEKDLDAIILGQSTTWPARAIVRACKYYGKPVPAQYLYGTASHRRLQNLISGGSYTRKQFLSGDVSDPERAWLLFQSGKSYPAIGKILNISKTRAYKLVEEFEKLK